MAGIGVGTGALSSLLGKLTTLLSDEYSLLKGVRKDIAFLERELRRMQILVNILADMENLDKLAKDWKDTMRDLSYDMEDCIDRFIVRLGKGDAKPGFMKRTARQLKSIFARHGIGTQIKELKARVVEESERRQRLNLDNLVTSTSRTVEIDPRLAAFYEEAKGLVAMDVPVNKVMAWLRKKSVELKVVAISGGGGLGKTTLAMEVYRKIEGYFDCRASVSVSRTLDLDKLLKDVLFQIDRKAFSKCKNESWNKEQLIPEIARILTRKRYFIIIDDVWKEEDWKCIKAAFPDNRNGSRIIATTRITNVARSCCPNSGDQLYQMPVLNDVDSRRLFFNIIFDHNNSCPPQLEKVSDKILKKCGGLPLAIITIASLLASKPHNTDVWERLDESIGNGLSYENDVGGKGMKDILLLSYWDLPHHLKTCLLYLCIYPEDKRISCEDLKWKWIAEGFVTAPRGNLSQEAENYFNELVNRNMVQPVDVDHDGLVHYCRVHDMVLDLIISLSEEENFATVLNGRVCNSLPSKIRRLSTQCTGQGNKGAINAVTTNKLHLRSLNVFGETEQITPLVDFHSLRVLDFDHCDWLEKEHIKNIASCSQLRYLRLTGKKVTKLPQEIGRLQCLETLDLRGCNELRTLPSTLVRLQKLVRLFIHHHLWLPAGVIGSLHALEELSHICRVDNPMKFAEELRYLTKLRKLSMSCYPDSICRECGERDYLKRYLALVRSSLSELCKYNLRHLHTTVRQEMEDYLLGDASCTFTHLHFVESESEQKSCFKRVPKGLASQNDIVYLDIQVEYFDEEGLNLLMGMPSLTHLQLKVINNLDYKEWTPHGFGYKMRLVTVGSNGFKFLKVFCFTLKEWKGIGIAFAPGAMPALWRLHLCWKALDVMNGYNEDGPCANMGIEHLSSLAHLQVKTDCTYATVAEVEAVEGQATAWHPNRHTLQVHLRRKYEHIMFKDKNERHKKQEADRYDQLIGES